MAIPLAAHGRKRKLKRAGRHAAPSQAHKVARAAGRAAPAVAVLGALAAAPQAHDLLASTAPAAAGHLTTAQLGNSGAAASEPADYRPRSVPAWTGPGSPRRPRPARASARARPAG